MTRAVRIPVNLQPYRVALALSQRALAAQLGMTQGEYANYESGIHAPSVRTAIRLAALLGQPVEVLWPVVGGAGPQPVPTHRPPQPAFGRTEAQAPARKTARRANR